MEAGSGRRFDRGGRYMMASWIHRRAFEKDIEGDAKSPISQKILMLIPELFAQEEAMQIASSVTAGRVPAKSRAGL